MNLYVNIIEFWSRLNSEIHITVLYGIRADIIIDNGREFVYNQIEVHSTVYKEESAYTQGSFLFEMKIPSDSLKPKDARVKSGRYIKTKTLE